jgi:hypothetical protein
MSLKIVKNIRRKRIEREEQVAFLTPELIPEEPVLLYTPETDIELHYFQKYAMMLALAKSQEQKLIDLNEKIQSLEKILTRKDREAKNSLELQKAFRILCNENGGLSFENRQILHETKLKLQIAEKLIKELTGKPYPPIVVEPIKELSLFDD